jgi:molecular chaperone DnaJ/curved DNA-binding protein
MSEDYYNLLGVERGASAAEIQKAYRKMAKKYHPDLNPDDKAAKDRFQKVQKAYEILNDPEKKRLYDELGPDFEQMHAGGGPQPGAGGFRWTSSGPGGFQGGPEGVDLGNIFSQMFGGGATGGFPGEAGFPGGGPEGFEFPRGTRGGTRRRQRSRPTKGADIHREITLAFTTAVLGGEAPLPVRRDDGSFGEISLKIPAGIHDGARLRLAGQGEPGPDGETPGDLYVTVHVGGHPWYHRRENDLFVKVPVTLPEAVLGAKIDIPTPRGTIALKIPSGTSSGKRLRLKGLGIHPAKGEPGDLFAEIQIVLPDEVDDDTRELARRLEARYAASPRREMQW